MGAELGVGVGVFFFIFYRVYLGVGVGVGAIKILKSALAKNLKGTDRKFEKCDEEKIDLTLILKSDRRLKF